MQERTAKPARRSSVPIAAAVVLVVTLILANIQQFGRAEGGYYDWLCPDCGAKLYCCPGKRLTYLSVPQTYETHAHSWQETHRPPRWSPWKPWQWLAHLSVDSRVLQEQQPKELFPSAVVNERNSDVAGLQRLAIDPQYDRKDQVSAIIEAVSRPG